MAKKKGIDYKEVNAARKEITLAARKLAEAKRAASPYSVEKQHIFIERLTNYIEEQEKAHKPLTISGFILASEISTAVWHEMKNGRYDSMIEEYKILHDIPEDAEEAVTEDGEVYPLIPWSRIIDRCYLLAQKEREEGCITGKAGNVVGNIFLLKAQHGLSDAPDQIQNQTNIQVVANSDIALKALEMCK